MYPLNTYKRFGGIFLVCSVTSLLYFPGLIFFLQVILPSSTIEVVDCLIVKPHFRYSYKIKRYETQTFFIKASNSIPTKLNTPYRLNSLSSPSILAVALSSSTNTFNNTYEKVDKNTESLKSSSTTTISKSISLAKLHQLLDASSCHSSSDNEPLLKLSSGIASSPEENNERGIMITQQVNENSLLLCIPLSSCLCDDSPPDWYYTDEHDIKPLDNDNDTPSSQPQYGDDSLETIIADQTNHHLHNPNLWATRLAASLLDIQDADTELSQTQQGWKEWLSLCPNPSSLRASLPVHWSDESLSKARCCALELAVDSAYFTRAEAVDALLDGLKRKRHKQQQQQQQQQQQHLQKKRSITKEEEDEGILAAKCHSALDFVQTRVCRVDRLNGLHPPMRLLAPIFDFINHGSSTANGSRKANAYFQLEQISELSQENNLVYLTVRASRDMKKNEEVLIDYGESTRPPWRCLVSYGFVPSNTDYDDDDDDDDSNQNVAEVFMDGVRYEVGKNTVPIDMVLATAATIASENGEYNQQEQPSSSSVDNPTDENPLTAAVALRIAKRVSDVAFDLLLENTNTNTNTNTDTMKDQKNTMKDVKDEDSESAAEIHASSLAASLRYSQHRVLMSCAMGLKEYASQNMGID